VSFLTLSAARSRAAAAALTVTVLGCAAPSDAPAEAEAAQSSGTDAQAMVDNLLTQEATVRDKLMALAEAIPEEDYDWRPMEGVRSVGEVFQHVAADNYLLPAIAGVAAPESTGIMADDYATVQAYEGRDLGKAEIVAQMEASFDHLESAVGATRGDLDASYQAFGGDFTGGGLWTMAVTHLHEHLGQAIAYARSNEVVPPWSR
jgi:uncharacterized damage-inducible protein DinB